MIISHYAGMQLVDIEEEAFSYGFDPDERFPALVLASCVECHRRLEAGI